MDKFVGRSITILICLCFVTGSFFIPVAADPAQAIDYEYILMNGDVHILKYLGEDDEVIVPSMIDGNPVVVLSDHSFSETMVTTVVIPDSITTIGPYCFKNCISMTTVIIGDGVQEISTGSFYNCWSLTTVDLGNSVTDVDNIAFSNCESLTSIELPYSVENVWSGAFRGCKSLTEIEVDPGNSHLDSLDGILYSDGFGSLLMCPEGKTGDLTIPAQVTTVDDFAFSDCDGLSSVAVQNNVIEIGKYAFDDCGSLTTVSLGSGVTMIGEGAFDDCHALENIFVGGSNTNYDSIDGVLFNKIGDSLIRFPHAKTGTYTVPLSVSSIEDGAFMDCWAITLVSLTGNVKTIGSNAFSGCDDLTFVTLAEGLNKIGPNAFARCPSLITISVPSSVTEIGITAFTECSSLVSIEVASANPSYSSVGGVLYNKDQSTLICHPSAKIGAFTVPDTVTMIQSWAFSKAVGLTSVFMGSQVVKVDTAAFNRCTNLTYVQLGASVELLNEPFVYCPSIEVFDVDDANSNFASVDGVLYDKDISTLLKYPAGKKGDFVTPEHVVVISRDAFMGCKGIEELTISDWVYQIGSNAFTSSSITSVVIGEGVTAIPFGAFMECVRLKDVEFGKNVTSINNAAFEYCYMLKSVTLPANLATISPNAFNYCVNLTSITFLGMVAPTVESEKWIIGTNESLVGHAYEGSNFPLPGESFHGLIMGSYIGDEEESSDQMTVMMVALVLIAIIAIAAVALLKRKKK